MASFKYILILYFFIVLQFSTALGAVMASSENEPQVEEDQIEELEDLEIGCEDYRDTVCDCGPVENEGSVSIRVKICSMKNALTDESFCEPCDSKESEEKLCTHFKNCDRCATDRKYCMSCPPGRDGKFCEISRPLPQQHSHEGHPKSSSNGKYQKLSRAEEQENTEGQLQDDRTRHHQKEEYGIVRVRPTDEDRRYEDVLDNGRNDGSVDLVDEVRTEKDGNGLEPGKVDVVSVLESSEREEQKIPFQEPINTNQDVGEPAMEDVQLDETIMDDLTEIKSKSSVERKPSPSKNTVDGFVEGLFEKILEDGSEDGGNEPQYDDLSSYTDNNDMKPSGEQKSKPNGIPRHKLEKFGPKPQTQSSKLADYEDVEQTAFPDEKLPDDNSFQPSDIPSVEVDDNVPETHEDVEFPIHVHYPMGKPIDQHRVQRKIRDTIKRCTLPDSSKTVDYECIYYINKVTCSQRCAWGYSYGEGTVRLNYCRYKDNDWQFKVDRECTSFVNCMLDIKGQTGEMSCATLMVDFPTYCNITCHSDHKTVQHVCSIDGKWTPPLPSCVEKRGDFDFVPLVCVEDDDEDIDQSELRRRRQRTRARNQLSQTPK